MRHGGDGRLRRRELQAQPRRAHGLVSSPSCTSSRVRSPKIAAGRGCPPSPRVLRAPTYLMIPSPVLPHIPRIQIQLAVPAHPHHHLLPKGTPGSVAPRPVIVHTCKVLSLGAPYAPSRSFLVLSVAVYLPCIAYSLHCSHSLLGLRSDVWISVINAPGLRFRCIYCICI